MSDDPLDSIPEHSRLSLRAVLVTDGEDAAERLAAAGIYDPVSLPVVFGESDDGLVSGITPNLRAVLECELSAAPGHDVAAQADFQAGESSSTASQAAESGGPAQPSVGMLPAAFGIQPLAPVRRR